MQAASAPTVPASAPVAAPVEDAPKLAGCVAAAARCVCFGSDGARMDKGPEFCTAYAHGTEARPAVDLASVPMTRDPRYAEAVRVVDRDAGFLQWGAR